MKACVLLSGGLDSAVCAKMAQQRGDDVFALSFDYGQPWRAELDAAAAVAEALGVVHETWAIRVPGAARIVAPTGRDEQAIRYGGTSPAYIPARNSIFIAYGLAAAEVHGCGSLWVGFNGDDRGFPDCSPAFVRNWQALAPHAVDVGGGVEIVAPLLHWRKAAILRHARAIGVPAEMTISCYQPVDGLACGACDACVLRGAP